MKQATIVMIAMISFLLTPLLVTARGEYAATLEVLAEGVEVQRVNTENWIPVKVEAIVGVGDTIRTDDTGRARITFFADGTDTELLPNTEYRITQFEADETSFRIQVAVLFGQTNQRLSRLLDANSNYTISTPGIQMAARGTAFAVRVEADSQRSAMIVTDGTVEAEAQATLEEVPSGFGVRAEEGQALSDVVPATSFEMLDAALDGCSVVITTLDDVSVNVRTGPAITFPRVGTLSAVDITTVVGEVESGDWYRIEFRDGYAWIYSTTASIDNTCVGLRQFSDNHGPEDATLYTSLGDEIQLDDLVVPPAAQDEATPEPTSMP